MGTEDQVSFPTIPSSHTIPLFLGVLEMDCLTLRNPNSLPQ